MRPPWADRRRQDRLALDDARDRVDAFCKWASIMQAWPAGDAVALPPGALESRRAYEAWEVMVVAFYCRAFHGHFARLPTTPLCAPDSIFSRAV